MILNCSGWGCQRLISISQVPGGNPVALQEPDVWAIEFSVCEDCKRPLCDRCTGKRGSAHCPECSGSLVDGMRQRERVRALPYPEAVTAYNEGMSTSRAT